MGRNKKRALTVGGVLLACVAVIEFGLRLYSYWTGGPVAALARQNPIPAFVFASADPWLFDPKHGFLGRPGLRYLMGSITNGHVDGCSDLPHTIWPGLESEPAWKAADLQIALFGVDDALAEPDWNGEPWPSILAGQLSQATGKRIVVRNYSRPSVSMLQSLVLAGEIAPATGAKLVVIATSTANLPLDFVYRTVGTIEGASVARVSSSDAIQSRPELGIPVGPLIDQRVTKIWCNQAQIMTRGSMVTLMRFDRLLNDLQEHANIVNQTGQRTLMANWTSAQPAIVRLMTGRSPVFAATSPVERVPIHYLANPNIAADQRAKSAAGALQVAAIPWIVLHSPNFAELQQRRVLLNYAGVAQTFFDAVLRSLETLGSEKLILMHEMLSSSDAYRPEALVNNPQGDWQLRVRGTELYAHMAARALLPIVNKRLER